MYMDVSGDLFRRDLAPNAINSVSESLILRGFKWVQTFVLLRSVSSSCFVVISASSTGVNL